MVQLGSGSNQSSSDPILDNMLRTIFFLAAYFASSIVLCQLLPDRLIPKNVPHADWQCFKKGYRAACKVPLRERVFICQNLQCADDRVSTNPSVYTAVSIGRPLDGTFCGLSLENQPRICYQGFCRIIAKRHRKKYLVHVGGKECLPY